MTKKKQKEVYPLKFLLIGDRHNSENTPRNRIDDFIQTMKNKDEEILKIAKDNKVAAIIQAGDFWTDSDAKPKNEFISEIIKRWVNPLNATESIPLIGIAGNHDLIGGNIHSLPNTALGLMSSLGYMRLLSMDNPIIFTLENGKTVAITGCNYHNGMDKPENISNYIVDKKLGDYHIHVVHGMLSPKNLGKIIRHTTIDAIKNTAADITFCGHDHIGFKTIEYDGKYFLNPGAIVRLKNDVKELSRTVKVVLLTIDDHGISLKEIPLKSALDSSLVLSREEIEQKHARAAAVEDIKSDINKLGLVKKTKFSEILDDVLNKEKVGDEIASDLKKRVADKEKEDNSHLKCPTDVAIKSVELKNFQSHEDTRVEFSDGFNIILGESRQGKTSIMRAIRWVLENKPTGNAMIRNGADSAFVTLELENGIIIKRHIGKVGNGYKVIFPDGRVEEGNTKMVGMVQSLCGFNDMVVSDNLVVPINFMRQGDGWYLIDDKTSSADRARILGSLSNTQAADAIVKDIDRENVQITSTIKVNSSQISDTTDEIKALNDKKSLYERIRVLLGKLKEKEEIERYFEQRKAVEEATARVETLVLAYEHILDERFIERIKQLEKDAETISDECDSVVKSRTILAQSKKTIAECDKFLAKERSLSTVKQKLEDMSNIQGAQAAYIAETKRQKTIKRMLEPLNGCKPELIAVIKEKAMASSELSNAMTVYSKEHRKAQAAARVINSTTNIDSQPNNIKRIKDLLKSKEDISSELATQGKLTQKLDAIKKDISSASDKIATLKAEKAQTLKDAHVCPVCSQIITDEVTQNIIGGD